MSAARVQTNLGVTGFDLYASGKQTCRVTCYISLICVQHLNDKTQSFRVAEGEAILASIFSEVAIAA